jgi:hypothetical protein
MAIPKSRKKSLNRLRPRTRSSVERVKGPVDMQAQTAVCPTCGGDSKRHSGGHERRRLCLDKSGPYIRLEVYSKHYCTKCRKHFSRVSGKARRASAYPEDIVKAAQGYWRGGDTLATIQAKLLDEYKIRVPVTTMHSWLL